MGETSEKKGEKLVTWILSGLGVLLLASGVVGYLKPDDSAKSVASPSSEELDPSFQQANAQSPILLVTVGSLAGDVRTPNLMKLAKHSDSFSNAVAASASSISGTVSVLTGVYPSKHQYYWMPWYQMADGRRVAEERATGLRAKTLAEMLPNYDRAAWVQDWLLFRGDAIKRGWKDFSIYRGPKDPTKDDLVEERTSGLLDLFKRHVMTRKVPKQFYWFHFDDLEAPSFVRAEDVARHLNGLPVPPESDLRSARYQAAVYGAAGNGKAEGRLARALYLAAVDEWDRNLGILIDILKRAGIYDDMPIVLVGSTGSAMTQTNAAARKGAPSFAKLHTPLLIKHRRQKKSAVHSVRVSTAAVAPTVRELAGYGPRQGFQTASLSKIIDQRRLASDTEGKHGLVLSESFEPGFRRLMVARDAAGAECHERLETKESPGAFYCFYLDMEKDPSGLDRLKWDGLSAARQKRLLQLKDEALAVLRTSGDPFSLVR